MARFSDRAMHGACKSGSVALSSGKSVTRFLHTSSRGLRRTESKRRAHLRVSKFSAEQSPETAKWASFLVNGRQPEMNLEPGIIIFVSSSWNCLFVRKGP